MKVLGGILVALGVLGLLLAWFSELLGRREVENVAAVVGYIAPIVLLVGVTFVVIGTRRRGLEQVL
jgi:heme/copper-type cytochrome/quinol oxidase subunit 1